MHWPDKGFQVSEKWILKQETLTIDLDVFVSLMGFWLTVPVEESLSSTVTVPGTDWRLERCVSLKRPAKCGRSYIQRTSSWTQLRFKATCKPMLELRPLSVVVSQVEAFWVVFSTMRKVPRWWGSCRTRRALI